MSDVRLTATNPEDSSVVPVACNAKGELKLEEPIAPPEFDGNLDGDLTVSGKGHFNDQIDSSGLTTGYITVTMPAGQAANSWGLWTGRQTSSTVTSQIDAEGNANFEGIVDVQRLNGGSLTHPNPAVSAVNGSALNGTIYALNNYGGVAPCIQVAGGDGSSKATIYNNGSSEFFGDVTVSSRNKQWMLVEQGGLCHMVEQTRVSTADLVDPDLVDPAFSVDPDLADPAARDLVDPAASSYPKLRDVFAELDVVEKALEQVMEKLRMVEPDGWPVWDGSSRT